MTVHDKGYKIASGCTLFPSKKIRRPDLSYLLKKESAKGILLTGTDEHVKQSTGKLEVRLDKPLGDALNSIFSHHGNVIFTFPGASDLQMREYLRTLEYETSKGTRKDDETESEILPHHGVQDIKGQRTGSTQAKEISTAAAEDSIKRLNEVSEAVLPYFNAEATKLIKDRGAVEVVSAALAYISGVTTRVKLISSQHNAQFTAAEKEIGAQQMKTKTHVKKCGQVTARQQREQSEPEIMANEEVPPHTHSDDNFSLQLVTVLLEPVSACVSLIREILSEAPHRGTNENDVVAVVLYPRTSEEILTVNPSDGYKVYFKHYNLGGREIEDTSLFIRVAFWHSSRRNTLWINYNTLLPITCERTMNNILLAKIPRREDNSFARESSLPWLDDILAEPTLFTDRTLFQESEEILKVLTLDNSPNDGRVNKESDTRNANAVISDRDSNMAFNVVTVYQ